MEQLVLRLKIYILWLPFFACRMGPKILQVVFVSLAQLLHISSAQQCKPPKYSEYGYALLSSAYLVLANEDLGSCYIKCVQDQYCSSINYDLANGKCEHNHVTKKDVPSRFAKKEQSVYVETRQSGLLLEVGLKCNRITEKKQYAKLQRSDPLANNRRGKLEFTVQWFWPIFEVHEF